MPVGHICLNNLLKQNGYVYPYVGIIQIRLWVRDAPPVLSLPAQAPLFYYYQNTPYKERFQA